MGYKKIVRRDVAFFPSVAGGCVLAHDLDTILLPDPYGVVDGVLDESDGVYGLLGEVGQAEVPHYSLLTWGGTAPRAGEILF